MPCTSHAPLRLPPPTTTTPAAPGTGQAQEEGQACSPAPKDHEAAEMGSRAPRPRSQGRSEPPPPGPASSEDPTFPLQEQEGPAPRDSVIGPSLAAAGLGGWEPVRSVPGAAPGRSATPGATEGSYPASFAGFTQRLGFQSRLREGRGRRAARAVSTGHPGRPHTCRESLLCTPSFCVGGGGYRREPPKVGDSQPGPGQPEVGSGGRGMPPDS